MRARLIGPFLFALPLLAFGCVKSDPITTPAQDPPDPPEPQWQAIKENDSSASFFYTSLWGASEVDLYVVGSRSTLDHFDGNAWTSITVPNLDPLVTLWDISGLSASDIWVTASDGKVLYYNGAAWEIQQLGSSGSMFSVWVLSRDELYVGSEDGKIYRFNGATWSDFADLGLQNIIDIWGTADNDIWAVTVPAIHHYDGSTWTKVIDDNEYQFNGITARGTGVILSGWSGSVSSGNGALFHYESNVVTEMPIANQKGLLRTFESLIETPSGTLLAGGYNGKIFKLEPDDTVWRFEDAEVDDTIEALWAAPTGPIYGIAGRSGIIQTTSPTGSAVSARLLR